MMVPLGSPCNDIRELENLDRIPAEAGGDQILINGNMLPLQEAGAAYRERMGGDNRAESHDGG